MRKKLLPLLLCAALLAALCVPASAARVTGAEAIDTLLTLGLARGDYNGFVPERAATRAEAAVMLLRLLGLEAEALESEITSPFTDASWAEYYLGYAHANGLVYGVSDTEYGVNIPVRPRDYVTMALRALGYADDADFTWEDSLEFAERIGLVHGEFTGAADEAFLREDLALVSYTALTLKMKDSDLALIESLYLSGAVSAAALKQTRLAGAVNAGRVPYSPVEIHELSASSMFYAELYATEEDLENGEPTARGSGFLISADGVAVMCYHELDEIAYVRATLLNGQTFDVTGVLFYDPFYDAAVVRLSMTDTEGNAIRRFPCLDPGDSDAVYAGDTVYVVSNSNGMIYSFSEGLVASRARTVYDPAYPYLQVSTPFTSGGSGSPLLNAYGEVIGIMFATFTRWEEMHLAVPINLIRDVDLSGAGVPVAEVLEIESGKKANAVITAEVTELVMEAGETEEILVSSDCPGILGVSCTPADASVASVAWGDFVTMQSCPLRVTALSAGETDLTIRFSAGYGNEDAELIIHVTVTGGEDTEEPPAEDTQETPEI